MTEKDGNDLCVFGFNGSFLGLRGRNMYDKKVSVGARKGVNDYKIEKIKTYKNYANTPNYRLRLFNQFEKRVIHLLQNFYITARNKMQQ